jgi:hypothetical protein
MNNKREESYPFRLLSVFWVDACHVCRISGGTVASFKCLALTSSVFPILFLVAFSFMPETPVYLYGKGRVDAARKSLEYFRGRHYNLDEELLRIADDIKEANTNKAKLSDLFSCRATLNGLIVSLGLMVFQQMSGINAVLFYTGNIFAETGSLMAPDTSAILVGTVQVSLFWRFCGGIWIKWLRGCVSRLNEMFGGIFKKFINFEIRWIQVLFPGKVN